MSTKQIKLVTVLSGLANVYALEKPVGINDCLVWTQISNVKQRNHSDKTGLLKTRFQIDAYGTTLANCRNLAMSVYNLLEANTNDFELATFEDEFYTKSIDTNLYRAILDFYIW